MDARLTAPRGALPGGLLVPAALAATLALTVRRFDAPPVLWGLCLAAAAVPLLAWPEAATIAVMFLLYTNIPVVAHQLYGVPQAAAGAFILLLGLPLLHALVFRREPVRADPAFVLLLCFLAVQLVSSLSAYDRGLALARVQTYVLEGVVLYWLVLNTVRRGRTLRRVVWTLLFAGGLLGGLTAYQSATGRYEQQFGGLAQRQLRFEDKRAADLLRGETGKLYKADRAEGPVGGPNRFAQILVVLLPLAVLETRHARTRRARALAAAAGALILAGVLLTYSRGSLVTLGAGVAVAVSVGWLRPRQVLVGALCAALLAPVVAPSIFKRVQTLAGVAALASESPAEGADGSIRGRATEMLAALNVFLDHPVLGVGPGQYMPFYSEEYHQNPAIKFRDIREVRRAHTLYFEMAAETGLVGLACFLGIPLVLLRQLWSERRRWTGRHRGRADLATAFWLAIVAYLGTAVFLHLSYERYYWLLLALAAAAVQHLRARPVRAGAGEG